MSQLEYSKYFNCGYPLVVGPVNVAGIGVPVPSPYFSLFQWTDICPATEPNFVFPEYFRAKFCTGRIFSIQIKLYTVFLTLNRHNYQMSL